MGPISNLKGIQWIMGFLASLSHFILCLGERGIPPYKLSRKAGCFEWTSEVHDPLDSLKNLLTRAHVLVALGGKESLLLYIAAIA